MCAQGSTPFKAMASNTTSRRNIKKYETYMLLLAVSFHLISKCKRYGSCSCRSTPLCTRRPHFRADSQMTGSFRSLGLGVPSSPAADRITRFFKWPATSHPFHSDVGMEHPIRCPISQFSLNRFHSQLVRQEMENAQITIFRGLTHEQRN